MDKKNLFAPVRPKKNPFQVRARGLSCRSRVLTRGAAAAQRGGGGEEEGVFRLRCSGCAALSAAALTLQLAAALGRRSSASVRGIRHVVRWRQRTVWSQGVRAWRHCGAGLAALVRAYTCVRVLA